MILLTIPLMILLTVVNSYDSTCDSIYDSICNFSRAVAILCYQGTLNVCFMYVFKLLYYLISQSRLDMLEQKDWR